MIQMHLFTNQKKRLRHRDELMVPKEEGWIRKPAAIQKVFSMPLVHRNPEEIPGLSLFFQGFFLKTGKEILV